MLQARRGDGTDLAGYTAGDGRRERTRGDVVEVIGDPQGVLERGLETHALSDVHLQIRRGEYVAIAGPSGSGKTTLLSILGLLEPPTSGEHWFQGRPVQSLNARERARIRNREIGFIFQNFNLIGDLTVYENAELPLLYRGLSSGERRDRVMAALERVQMAHTVRHMPSQLSGGQQQRVAVARAVAGARECCSRTSRQEASTPRAATA